MIALHLLRHAHAGDPERWSGDDSARPLSDRGRRQAERLGRFLAGSPEPPDLLISSPRLRALETADTVAGILGVPVVKDPRLAQRLEPGLVTDILLAAGPAARPCLVGHDPDLSSLLGQLLGIAELPMRKGAVARVDLPGRTVAAGRGVLRYLVPPELLGGE